MIIELNGIRPDIDETAYIAPTAVIVGDVSIGPEASVWFGAIIRGDEGKIIIGARSSIQDNAVLHVNASSDTVVESDVTIAHGVVMEGCRIGKGSLVGMNSTILSGAEIGENVLVAAGSLILENQKIPANHMAAGTPSRVLKPLSDKMKALLQQASKDYVGFGRLYIANAKLME
jgi:carbonic anhydrase/acetyltransferase-like protein (isoleucine patch superfamily)